ncbi:MAG: glycosyltransferase family 2 protein [Bacteroidales bacterium]|nr:glycosyltransferase family 2 protein [Bacteroidales bacterium]
MPKISVAIITLNEARNIGRCLESVRDIADEVVVVDSFSTDDTEKICRKHRVRFIQHLFEGYIEQKNFALSQTTHNYVLSLDADEALSDELKAAVIQAKSNLHADGYTMNRLTNYIGKWIRHCGWYPDTKLRLFNRAKGKWGGVNPHDEFLFSGNATTVHLKGDLLHYSFFSIEDHHKQIEHFTDIAARAYFEKGKKASLVKLVFSPFVRFIRDYFLLLGFLDGKYGLIICYLSARSVSMKYRKLKNMNQHASLKKL